MLWLASSGVVECRVWRRRFLAAMESAGRAERNWLSFPVLQDAATPGQVGEEKLLQLRHARLLVAFGCAGSVRVVVLYRLLVHVGTGGHTTPRGHPSANAVRFSASVNGGVK